MRWFYTVVLCLVTIGVSQTVYVSPLTGNLDVHDPCIIKTDGTYYIFYTGNGVSFKTSPDRIAWTNRPQVIPSGGNPAWQKTYVPSNPTSLWAPDIHFANGKNWLYYAVSTFGSNTSAIGLRTSATLNLADTGWQDQGMVIHSISSDNYNAIDPNVYVDSTGTPWLLFGSFWGGIQMVKLNAATGKPDSANAPLTTLAARPGVASDPIEGSFLIHYGKYYYLWVSFDYCCSSPYNYNIRVGRSASLAGPYVDSAGVSMLQGGGLLIDSGDARWKATGHNAVLFDGDSTFLVFHALDSQNKMAATLQIRALYWTAQGWPTLNPSQAAAVLQNSGLRLTRSPGAQWRSGFLAPWRGGDWNAQGRAAPFIREY